MSSNNNNNKDLESSNSNTGTNIPTTTTTTPWNSKYTVNQEEDLTPASDHQSTSNTSSNLSISSMSDPFASSSASSSSLNTISTSTTNSTSSSLPSPDSIFTMSNLVNSLNSSSTTSSSSEPSVPIPNNSKPMSTTGSNSSVTSSGSQQPHAYDNTPPFASSPDFTGSSPTFNRWPLSDTPVGSHTNSPREYPLSIPYNFGGSGTESLRTTPPSSHVNVPALSISGDDSSSFSNTSATNISTTTTTTTTTTTANTTTTTASPLSDQQTTPVFFSHNLSTHTHPPSALGTLSPMVSGLCSTGVSPSGTPIMSATTAPENVATLAISPSSKPSSQTSAANTSSTEKVSTSDVPSPENQQTNSSPSTTTTTTTTTTRKTIPSPTNIKAEPKPESQHKVQAPIITVTSTSTSTTSATTTPIPPYARSSAKSGSGSSRRATTLDVPGLTRSRVSPNGHISQRDVGSKLVIVMVGLPARGKSYVTNKLCRYLNWQQHNARIFNVGNTRRKASKNPGPASVPLPDSGPHTKVWSQPPSNSISNDSEEADADGGNKNNNNTPTTTNDVLSAADSNHGNAPTNSTSSSDPSTNGTESNEKKTEDASSYSQQKKGNTEQNADFFSPKNEKSFALREQWAMDTLDELLDYVITGPGSVGILDATNTTIARRKKVLNRIKERSDGQLKVLFLESICTNNHIIENNIRLKLSGPDYKDCDTEVALKDFVDRMRNYEKVYQAVTEGEDDSGEDFQYIKMIDVGKKVVCYNIKGFLAGQVVFFLLNFNLAERQIWITRHGESTDNAAGRIGGDAGLTPRGKKFAKALSRFMDYQKTQFRKSQLKKHAESDHFLTNSSNAKSPDHKNEGDEPEEPNFCVWTSMLRRSIDTAEYFDEEEYDIKEMRMLNELGAGFCDGMTYPEIKMSYPQEYQARMSDKITYRYPGPGGESYLDVINRLRPVIVEVERMTDNNLIIAHRVVCRILLAYFMNLGRDAIGDLDVPLHTLYCLEPKPYGVSWEAYEYDDKTDWFYRVPKETMLERNRRPSIAPQLSGRTRQYSVMPTNPDMKVPNATAGPFSFSPQSPFANPSIMMGMGGGHNFGSGAPGFSAQRGLAPPGSNPSATTAALRGGGIGGGINNTGMQPSSAPNFSFSQSSFSTLPTVSELSAHLNTHLRRSG